MGLTVLAREGIFQFPFAFLMFGTRSWEYRVLTLSQEPFAVGSFISTYPFQQSKRKQEAWLPRCTIFYIKNRRYHPSHLRKDCLHLKWYRKMRFSYVNVRSANSACENVNTLPYFSEYHFYRRNNECMKWF